MLTKGEIAGFQEILITSLQRLRGDLGQLRDEVLRGTGGEASGSLSNVPLHLADLGSRQSEENLDLHLVKNEEHVLEEIDAALTRIEQGKFGICEACRQAIHKNRLEAVPYSRYCVACARNVEKQGRR